MSTAVMTDDQEETGMVDRQLHKDAPRHAHLEIITTDIARIIHGRDAHAARADLPAPATMYALPLWAWTHAEADLGRKDRAADGARLLMPARLDWDIPSIGMITDATTATYTVRGLGITRTGSVLITPTATPPGSIDSPPVSTSLDSIDAWTARVSPDLWELHRHLITHRAESAYWALIKSIERNAEYYLVRSSASLAISLGTEVGSDVIDDVEREAIIATYVLGADGENGDSKAMRLVERCLAPGAFERVDPQRMITKSVRRDMTQELRSFLGDSRQGSTIREIARHIGAFDAERDVDVKAVRDEFNRQHPEHPVGDDKVRNALRLRGRAPAVPVGEEPDGRAHRVTTRDGRCLSHSAKSLGWQW